MYASLEDLDARSSPRLIAELSGAENGFPCAERLTRALADASAEIDAYLAARFCLPLVPPPTILVRIACDFALYRLFEAARVGDVREVRQRYEDGLAWLKAVAAGDLMPFPGAEGRSAGQGSDAAATGGAALARREPIFAGNWGGNRGGNSGGFA